MDTNKGKQDSNTDTSELKNDVDTSSVESQKNTHDVSGDDLQRMAQSFAGKNAGQVPEDSKEEATDLHKEIMSAFSGEDIASHESLKDEPHQDHVENPLDLNESDSSLQDIAKEMNALGTKPSEPISGDDESKKEDDFPFPSVPPKDPVEDSVFSGAQTLASENIPAEGPGLQKDEAPIADVEGDAIDDLQQNIAQDFADTTTPQQEIKKASSDLGIEKTYFKDLSGAMSANEPQTMSELLQKSTFEKKEKSVLSPTSKKNLRYIIGALILLVVSVIAWFALFGNKEEVEFITEERVRSLVYSDEDLGINTSGLETFQTKAAIRRVLERKHSPETLSQVYYVKEDNSKNLRRIGMKDIFEATDNQTPELLYNSVENDFMHGVYTTDKNYPFIVLKALSYDRAFEGMKQWEPTMIDDLSTYFDLPPEATDRSLVKDGFSDDLIKNKNVRVARFIPRESDRRGILDFIRSDGSEFQQEQQQGELGPDSPTPLEGLIDEDVFQDESGSQNLSAFLLDIIFRPWRPKPVLAQGVGGSFLSDTLNASGTTRTVCYRSTKKCIDLRTGQTLPGNSTPSTTVACYDEIFNPENPDQLGETFTPEEVNGQPGFICREVLAGGDILGTDDLINTDPICFDPVDGERLTVSDQASLSDAIDQPYGMCFSPYQCRRVGCYEGLQEVPASREGQPGIECRITDEVVEPSDNVRKSCVQFNELLALQNIQNLNLCFDENGRFVELDNRVQTLGDYYNKYARTSRDSVQELINSNAGLTCIAPQNRYKRLCLSVDGKVIPGVRQAADGSEVLVSTDEPEVGLCFEPFPAESLGEMHRTINGDVREVAAAVALKLEFISRIAGIFGSFGSDVSDILSDAANVFWQIAYGNVLDSDIVLRVAETTRQLELLLRSIDPGAPDSQVVAELQSIIKHIKDALGLTYNVTWVTLGNQLPQGIDIYPGDQVEGLSAIQQTLVLLGLMDPLSVNGEFDLVTQDAIASFIAVNGGEVLSPGQIFISAELLELLQQMVSGSGGLFGGGSQATINDFFDEPLGLGAFNEQVQALQILLYVQGYNVSSFNGIFDEEVCLALQQYQINNDLELADPTNCQISAETLEALNIVIRDGNYLGSGFVVNSNGALEGTGSFLGTLGPGAIDFGINEVEANSLREGDVVLLYTFLDEQTILITRHESVITEIIKRRAFNDIFNKQ